MVVLGAELGQSKENFRGGYYKIAVASFLSQMKGWEVDFNTVVLCGNKG